MKLHLAEINLARLIAPLDDPRLIGFVSQLDAINTPAEASPGFVWRLKTEDGKSSTYVRAVQDPLILINMSVWESVDALRHYAYRSGHGSVYRDRLQWFVPMEQPHLALWWIPVGHVPTVEEGFERLRRLKQLGPTMEAFTFKQTFS